MASSEHPRRLALYGGRILLLVPVRSLSSRTSSSARRLLAWAGLVPGTLLSNAVDMGALAHLASVRDGGGQEERMSTQDRHRTAMYLWREGTSVRGVCCWSCPDLEWPSAAPSWPPCPPTPTHPSDVSVLPQTCRAGERIARRRLARQHTPAPSREAPCQLLSETCMVGWWMAQSTHGSKALDPGRDPWMARRRRPRSVTHHPLTAYRRIHGRRLYLAVDLCPWLPLLIPSGSPSS